MTNPNNQYDDITDIYEGEETTIYYTTDGDQIVEVNE